MPLGSPFRPSVVGLDIGSSVVRAVALRQGRGGWSLVAAGEAPVVQGDGFEAPEDYAVSDTLRELVDSFRLRRASVAAALSGSAVIVKRLTMPAMTKAELDEAIPWEAEQYIPFDLADVQIDFQVVPGSESSKAGSVDVLLVAAKRERIEERVALIEGAGRTPVVLDVEAFALANAYQMNYPERSDPLTALVHLGHRGTVVCLLEKGQPAFTRDIAIGGETYRQAIVRELGVDGSTAERVLAGQPPGEVGRDQVAAVLRDISGQLVMEIGKTLDFYRATAPIEHLSRVVLSGGACLVAGLKELLATEFSTDVDIFDPFRRVTRSKRSGGEAEGPAYAVAVGLAMRREKDR